MAGGERVENTMPKWSSSISGEGTSTTGGPAGCEGGGRCDVCMWGTKGMVGSKRCICGEGGWLRVYVCGGRRSDVCR